MNYSDIESILKEEIQIDDLRNDYKDLSTHLKIIEDKLLNNMSILDETIHLKFLQIFLIKYCKVLNKIIYKFNDYSKYPAMIKFLEDIDFCLKYFFFRTYGWFKDIIYVSRCKGSLDDIDKRIPIFYAYCSIEIEKQQTLKHISEKELKIMQRALIIKDFIVIGNTKLYNEIKIIENTIIHKKIVYLSMIKVRDYLNEKTNVKKKFFLYIYYEG